MTNKIAEYRDLMNVLRQNMKDYILMKKVSSYIFADGVDEVLTYGSSCDYECFFLSHLQNKIEDNLLKLRDLIEEE